jgi:gamma-glutamylcyclotransferase
MEKIIYFAYGSNMNLTQMKKRCPDSQKLGIGLMKNAVLCFPSFGSNWNSGVAGFKHSDNKDLWGVLYEISENDLSSLRFYEDFNPLKEAHLNNYNETIVSIFQNNESVLCMTYEAVVTGNYQPSLSYLKTIISGAVENELPEYYIDELSQLL